MNISVKFLMFSFLFFSQCIMSSDKEKIVQGYKSLQQLRAHPNPDYISDSGEESDDESENEIFSLSKKKIVLVVGDRKAAAPTKNHLVLDLSFCKSYDANDPDVPPLFNRDEKRQESFLAWSPDKESEIRQPSVPLKRQLSSLACDKLSLENCEDMEI